MEWLSQGALTFVYIFVILMMISVVGVATKNFLVAMKPLGDEAWKLIKRIIGL